MANGLLINSKPKQLAQELARQIELGELRPGQPLASIRELVKTTELSQGTVLKGLELLTQQGLIERHPSRGFFVAGASETQTGTDQIAFLTLALSGDLEPYMEGFRDGMMLRGKDCLVSLFSCNSNAQEYSKLITKIINLNPIGIVACAVPEEIVHVDYEKLQSCGVPIVLFGSGCQELAVNRIVIPPEEIGRRLAARVLEKGYKKPAILNSYPYPEYSRQMMRKAFLDKLAGNGVIVPKENHIVAIGNAGYLSNPDPYIDAERAMAEALSKGLQCDVLMVDHDYPAVGAMRAITKAGYGIPGDIAVISGGECCVDYGELPTLTTIRSPHRKQGELAAQLLFDSIGRPNECYGIHYLPVELIEGKSC
jgi:DNA-binding LacI/PurR family transcriptional regulator